MLLSVAVYGARCHVPICDCITLDGRRLELADALGAGHRRHPALPARLPPAHGLQQAGRQPEPFGPVGEDRLQRGLCGSSTNADGNPPAAVPFVTDAVAAAVVVVVVELAGVPVLVDGVAAVDASLAAAEDGVGAPATGTTSRVPAMMRFGSPIPLARASAATVVP